MDERQIEAPTQRPVAPHEQSESRTVSIKGTGVRIDAPHVSTGAEPPTSRANSLLEAGRILEQLQRQDSELTQREAVLEAQIAQFEGEQQRLQLQLAADQAQLLDQRQKLKAEEGELARRLIDAQGLLAQIDTARLAVEQERAQVERLRESLQEELQEELRQERQAIEADRQELSQELDRARTLTTSLDERLRQTTADAEKLVQAERERLWHALVAEWEDRRAQFQSEHDAWMETVQAEKVEIEREKAFYEAAVRNAESDFSEAREAQAAELQAERALLMEKMQAEGEEWQRTLAEQQARLQAECDEWNKTRSSQLSEIQNERAVLENRIRFQQEHLERLRADLERSQNEHKRERQIQRQRLEDDSQQMIRRLRHIDLYRASIDEREKSLERERDVLEKSRRAFTSTVDMDRLTLQREQSAWQAERQTQQSELIRQQEMYTSHAESLESRRIRLEKLRTELEETHRSTLEMRLAVEEAWVELTQKAGHEEARQRVEQVRDTLVGYYRQLHEGLVEQRREHLESQTRFERQRAEFHDERQKLMEWIATRDQELRIGEERLRLAADDAAMHDSAWQVARDRWMQEKAEAEQVIRKLLAELGNQHREPLALPEMTAIPEHVHLAEEPDLSAVPGPVRMD